jgi:predicted nucleic acid-binding protein
MSEVAPRFVVDASVGIKLFVDEEFSDKATQLFGHPQARLFIPDLFYIECANILLKYTRRFNRPAHDAEQDLADLGRLALDATPTSELIDESLALALEYNLSAYDACYAVLARRLEIPLLTADGRLANAIPWAVWIGDFS